ncbi:hypothetical protein WJ0W_005915 [Paenibacillus melissococcoides]|uniref:Uncharacterized protein n=1 Tax=Paenibacillus melissococcoides TaxID=2912268 RepID=A0ABM9G9N3_9BACL|nr:MULTISPECIES: hypothetical protein [Paenibacillus]MEB9895744.1 hypothetical protein [Bacillus cereus]CAH8248731.1 hypothetical protein WJ0W_005915 [Paenibacillus melissococcoides]CAH8713899.1 hypothetical protein WDD9_003699 [Paenibacillus melissococcoides]CAH8720333.1 hypothetical protein HTL2_005908 [Paenibacillus melissococcoides]GIO78411.1 hypothetical protein J6TS7_20210 [Paenibacillus dendritiformis]
MAEPLPWHVKLWCALPLALIFVGGAVGGALAAIAALANFALFRTQLPAMTKYMTTLFATIACGAGWWMLAMMAAGRQ